MEDKTYRTMLTRKGSSDVEIMDTIKNGDRFWLVPLWIETLDGKTSTPERVVPLDQFEYQEASGDPAHFVVRKPIPQQVFDCRDPANEAQGFEVYLSPGLATPPDVPKQ